MVRLYMVIGSAICLFFVSAGMQHWILFDVGSVAAVRTSGGASHFHK